MDQKPPGVFWVYRLALDLPFAPVSSIHFMGLLFGATAAVAVFFVARRFTGLPWATITACLFAILSVDPLVEGTTANTELFMLLPLVLSQWAFLSLSPSNRGRNIQLMILAGILTGCAMAFKQVAAVNWFFLAAICPVYFERENRLRNTLSFAALSAAGVGFVWAGIAVYFLLHHGFSDFIDNVFTHNLEYVQTVPWPTRLMYFTHTLTILLRTQGLIWLFSMIGLAALLFNGQIRRLLFLAGWLATSLVGVSASGYYFPHYFQQILPLLAILAGLGAEALFSAPLWKGVPYLCRGTVMITALFILPVMMLCPFIFIYSPPESVSRIYPGDFFAEMPEVGKHIAQITNPADRVFVFGAESELLFYSQRVSATRYIFLFPLYGPYRDAREKQLATSREITLNRPKVIAWLPNQLFFAPDTEQFFTQWAQSYLHDNFHNDTLL
ncbi:MAG TPA: glycosyltransferase family 39 protein, partial [Phycisphaerae bacterium]|nr:glycosyltransferase family 39 protein [Phycisphaerae bacterium]